MVRKKIVFYLILASVATKNVWSEGVVKIYVAQYENCNSSSFEVVPVDNSAHETNVQLCIPSNSYFFIVQVHHHVQAISLSYDAISTSQNSVTGTNIGLNQINNKKGAYNFYLFHNFTTINAVLFAVTSYSEKAPMPGGCKTKLNNMTAPFEKITYDDALITVDVQDASINNQPCNMEQNITMDFYRLFVHTTNPYNFQDLLDMLTPDSIKKNGVKIFLPSGGSTLRRYFNNYRGYPVLFAVIASHGNESASYVPAWTYGCDMTHGMKSCYDTNFRGNWIVMTTLCYISLILLLIPRVATTVPFLNIIFYGGITMFALFGLESFYLTIAIFLFAITNAIILEWFYKYSERHGDFNLRVYASSIWTIVVYNLTFEGTSAFLQSRTYFWLLYVGVCWLTLYSFLGDYAHYTAVAFNFVLAVSMIAGHDKVLYININAIRRIAITNFNWANLQMPTIAIACGSFVVISCLLIISWKYVKNLLLLIVVGIVYLVAPAYLDNSDDDSSDERDNEETPLLP